MGRQSLQPPPRAGGTKRVGGAGFCDGSGQTHQAASHGPETARSQLATWRCICWCYKCPQLLRLAVSPVDYNIIAEHCFDPMVLFHVVHNLMIWDMMNHVVAKSGCKAHESVFKIGMCVVEGTNMPPAQGLHDTSNQMPAIATIICGAITFRQSPLSCPPVRRNIRAQLKHWVSAAQFQSDPSDTHQSPSIRR